MKAARLPPDAPKVFGIGFHKTATTSLAAALKRLGYRVTGPNGVDNPNIAEEALALALDLVPQYDAFQDNPWPLLFREVDARFPGSRFILTIRDPEAWLASVVKHFGETDTPMRAWIYGVGHPAGNEAVYAERYARHQSDVLAYFADRPGDLLVMDITRGDGWDVLCPFLGRPKPRVAFPLVNPAGRRGEGERRWDRLVRTIRGYLGR